MARSDQQSLFDVAVDPKLIDGLREISDLRNHQEVFLPAISEGLPDEGRKKEGEMEELMSCREVSDKKLCTTCQCFFENRDDQMEHYKLDWHRFNLRQRLAGQSVITVEEFEKKTGTGDMSSISGSDSEEEESQSEDEGEENEDEDDGVIFHGGCLSSRVLFQNSQGQYLCLYRCAVQNRLTDSKDNLVDSLLKISANTVWVILMTGGGHFAGAVYKGKTVLQHKTFHRYTVRAKRGTAQSVRDAQNKSHAPKSAGSALRRYNEAMLTKEIQELLKNWAEYLTQAAAIFLRTPKYNRGVFLGGRGAVLEKKDSRIHSIPFATRRATFKEIQRVHDILSALHVYDKSTDIITLLSPAKRVWQRKPASQSKQTTTAIEEKQPEYEVDDDDDDDDEDKESSVQLEMVEMTFSTLDLRDHEIKPTKKRRRRRKDQKPEEKEKDETEDLSSRKKKEEKIGKEIMKDKMKTKSKEHQDDQDESCVLWEYDLRDALYTACKTGDVEMICSLMHGKTNTLPQHLNTPIDSADYTLLHVASASAQKHAVKLLLEKGSDPTCRDRNGQTPYAVAPDKETKNIFRKFMAENPEKYNYAKAQIPGPLTAEMESKKAEKKKAQKAAKKQREKEQKDERRKEEEEQEEKRRFLALSDREKRALAAERRLAEQAAITGATITNIRRCWQCGDSLLGKVPFEYLNLFFCSTKCLQTHRRTNNAAKP
ncbi:tRNA endonuclease ANKZF1 [Trichomycterus rosablanca]|uniref:tRNA endonuclease ANKZF1 n=1 Tax=Trichomycterus rosablanca TaxID=2290929 RepID=UPI002F35605A